MLLEAGTIDETFVYSGVLQLTEPMLA